MKLTKILLPSLSTLLLASGAMAAPQQSTGTINFTGFIGAATCEVNGGKDLNVYLGRHEVSKFTGTGTAVKGDNDVNLTLTNCSGNAQLRLVGEKHAGGDKSVLALKEQTGSASGVGIALKRDNDPGRYFNLDGSDNYDLQVGRDGSATFKFMTYYLQKENRVTEGKADGTLTYTITYS
ncbi:type 1 fimbrial protein [Morganella morganii]|uniref:fimbrial protein n=1 Tax=Morganella morganii TaxID=582 RepID=UPI00164A7719|nr:fimbrial protein [Morganella morganii]MBC4012159.1 type 1 fimbrial protein [Morganella morganii]MCF1266442.1 type 1 fimbrial protein [Morganella morganii]